MFTDSELKLLDMIEAEKQRNHELTTLLLRQNGLQDQEIIAAESQKSLGKIPWEIRKQQLELKFSKKVENDPLEVA